MYDYFTQQFEVELFWTEIDYIYSSFFCILHAYTFHISMGILRECQSIVIGTISSAMRYNKQNVPPMLDYWINKPSDYRAARLSGHQIIATSPLSW
jgi:hypothetical protein